MADLGAIGVKANLSGGGAIFNTANQTYSTNPTVIGYGRGIALGGPTSIYGDGTMGRHLQIGVTKNTNQGSPDAPSLELKYPGMWRFRWVVKPGSRSVSIKCKQVENLSPRPSMIVKANVNVGITTDLTSSAPSGTDWVTIGPITLTSTGTGVVWVELYNNIITQNSSVYFDHIVVT